LQGLSDVRKKLNRWLLKNSEDKGCDHPDATERVQAMNERFAKLKEAVEEEPQRRRKSMLQEKVAKQAAEVPPRSLHSVRRRRAESQSNTCPAGDPRGS